MKMKVDASSPSTMICYSIVLLFLLVVVSGQTQVGGTDNNSNNVLLVGDNSLYSNNLPNMVQMMLRVSVVSQSRDGAQLHEYADSFESILSRRRSWRWTILQEDSEIPGLWEASPDVYDSSLRAVVNIDDKIKNYNGNGAAPDTVLLMTWARKSGDYRYPTVYPDFLTMQGLVAEGYYRYRDAIDTDERPVKVAPVGIAFEMVYQDTLLELQRQNGVGADIDPTAPGTTFSSLFSDGSLPSMQGTYLAACVIYATLTGGDPLEVNWAPAGLDDEWQEYLQRIAAGAVRQEEFRLTVAPTASPTTEPTAIPTATPTTAPTSIPTTAPTTSEPTALPTTTPTSGPTATPTATPTSGPTSMPTAMPTSGPTAVPTSPSPTRAPSDSPVTPFPTVQPTTAPTLRPTFTPTTAPPTSRPTRRQRTSRPTREPTPPPPCLEQVNIMWFGNGYSQSMEMVDKLRNMLEEGSPEACFHFDVHTDVTGAQLASNIPLMDEYLEEKPHWNYLIVQEQSQVAGFYGGLSPLFDESLDAIRVMNDKMHDYNAQAAVTQQALAVPPAPQTVLMMTWGRRDGDDDNLWLYPNFQFMQNRITRGYEQYLDATFAERRAAIMAPVGLAFEMIYEDVSIEQQQNGQIDVDPSVDNGNFFSALYDDNGSHLSGHGAYLAALVLYASMTGEDPRLLRFGRSRRKGGYYRSVAAVTVENYFVDNMDRYIFD